LTSAAFEQELRPLVRLVSFGAGSKEVKDALMRLRYQALDIGLIDEVKAYSEDDLGVGYREIFGDLPESNPKGYGLWSWKPYLLLREAKTMNEGDILFYADAGVEINLKGSNRLADYLEQIARTGSLFFSLSYQNRFWTRNAPELVNSSNFFRNQVSATVFGIRVSRASLELLEGWLQLSAKDGGALLKDADEGEAQIPGFAEHRHDQSTLSAVVYQHNVIGLVPDETWFKPWRRGKSMPFLAMRNKTGKTYLPIELAPYPIRQVKRCIRFFANSEHRRLVSGNLTRALSPKIKRQQ
jgi:hypothetical protein